MVVRYVLAWHTVDFNTSKYRLAITVCWYNTHLMLQYPGGSQGILQSSLTILTGKNGVDIQRLNGVQITIIGFVFISNKIYVLSRLWLR